MGSNVKNMFWEQGVCGEGGDTVFVCIIIRPILRFWSFIYKTTDFKHSLSSCGNYFLNTFLSIFQSLTASMWDLSLLNSYFFQCSNSHKIEVITPALQSCHENLFDQVPNVFVISYQDKNENDSAIKLAVHRNYSLHKQNFTGLQYMFWQCVVAYLYNTQILLTDILRIAFTRLLCSPYP